MLLLASPAWAQTAPTLVQQLTARLAYVQQQAILEPNETYYQYRAIRLANQLAAAIAAQNAGTPLPPVTDEFGNVAPVYSGNASAHPTGRNSR
jgi:hypothetical protein